MTTRKEKQNKKKCYTKITHFISASETKWLPSQELLFFVSPLTYALVTYCIFHSLNFAVTTSNIIEPSKNRTSGCVFSTLIFLLGGFAHFYFHVFSIIFSFSFFLIRLDCENQFFKLIFTLHKSHHTLVQKTCELLQCIRGN